MPREYYQIIVAKKLVEQDSAIQYGYLEPYNGSSVIDMIN
jgi:hypothetical protein